MKPLQAKKLDYDRPGVGPHKGDNGRVLVVGGSKGYVGCVYLSAIAALRSGADYVTVAAPEKVAFTINRMSPDLVTVKLPGDYITSMSGINPLFEKCDVMLFGNGMGTNKTTAQVMQKLAQAPMLKVLDAAALRVVSMKNLEDAVLTPHLGEFFALVKTTTGVQLSGSDHEKIAQKGWQLLRPYLDTNIVVLKGATDYVLTKNEIFYNTLGNPRMRVAGTGDVLAGAISGILAQHKQPLKSIEIALPAVCSAGDILYAELKGSYTASDLLAVLHRTIFK